MHDNLPDAPGQRIHIGYKNIPPIISRCIDSNVLPCKAQAIHMDHSKRDCRRKKAYAKQQGQKNGIESLGLFASHGKIAVIEGTDRLSGAHCKATDLRGGAALVIAALRADGESRIGEIHHIERGYDDIVGNLSALGADIKYSGD